MEPRAGTRREARAHLLAVRHSPGARLLSRTVPQVLVVVTGARLLAKIPRPPGGVGTAQALGAALAGCQLQRGARFSAAAPGSDQGGRGAELQWSGAVPAVTLGQMPGWGMAGAFPRDPLSTGLHQGLHTGAAACAVSTWRCDPGAWTQDPGQASPGITPWEQECRAPAPRITGSLSPVGPGPSSKPLSEQGSQAARPQLTPAHTAAALRVVLPSTGAAGGHVRSLGLGCLSSTAPLSVPGPRY